MAAAKRPKLTVAGAAALQKDMLPEKARRQLSTLVTEVHGAAMVLRAEVVIAEEEDMYTAVSMWLDRIAHDLGEMECQRYPAESEDAK
jgi:hypothetical protein